MDNGRGKLLGKAILLQKKSFPQTAVETWTQGPPFSSLHPTQELYTVEKKSKQSEGVLARNAESWQGPALSLTAVVYDH